MKYLFLSPSSFEIRESALTHVDPQHVRSNVSTDEIYPAKYCMFYKNIGRYALTGDRNHAIKEEFIELNQIKALIAGENFGCGSAREHAAITLKEAGIRIVYAVSFNKTFRNNCIALGLLTTTNPILLEKITTEETITIADIDNEFTGTEKEIIDAGGLFAYDKNQGINPKHEKTSNASRPGTIAEKIIAHHVHPEANEQVPPVPGEDVMLPVDIRFSYEVFTPLISEVLTGNNYTERDVIDPESIYLFEDHFVLSKHPEIPNLLTKQASFAQKVGTHLTRHGENGGICHTILVEKIVTPGQVVVGTDSHTGTSGALNALCIPVGATTMANAFITKNILFKVPHTIRVNFNGSLPGNVMAKDLMLHFFAHSCVQEKRTLGCILEFGGSALKHMPVDELTVFPNMAAEAGALTGIVEPTETMVPYLKGQRGDSSVSDFRFTHADPGAEYSEIVDIDAAVVTPMIAKPADPTNVIPLSSLGHIPIHKAFIGSCTGGKIEDMRRAASVINGKTVARGVEFVVHPASMNVMRQMKKEGLDTVFLKAGAAIYPSACGACIGQGPGSVVKGEVVISSSNRNFYGRMGTGESYLSNPMVVAYSALNGHICYP